MNRAGGEEKQLVALFIRDAGAPTISAPIVRRGRGSAVNGGVVRRAARGAVRRLSVIRANDGGRALRGTMSGAAGFCRSEWLIGLPGGCEGAVSGGGGGEGRRSHCPRTGPGAEARPSAARPPPCPEQPTGRPRRGGPLEAWWEMAAGAVGAWVS